MSQAPSRALLLQPAIVTCHDARARNHRQSRVSSLARDLFPPSHRPNARAERSKHHPPRRHPRRAPKRDNPKPDHFSSPILRPRARRARSTPTDVRPIDAGISFPPFPRPRFHRYSRLARVHAFVIRRAGLRPLALSVKSPRPARMTARVNRRRALEFAARRLVATHLTDLPPRSSARRTNPRASAAPTRRPAVAVAVALGDPTAREALARRRLTSRDLRKSPFNAVSRSTDRGRQTRGEAAREGLSRRSRLVRIRHVESHLAGRGGYGHPRVWVPEAAGRARACERERESAARAMGACASRCAREEMRGVGVVMSRGASSDAGGGRRADG